MKKIKMAKITRSNLYYSFALLLITSQLVLAQDSGEELKWIRIGSIQNCFSAKGAEVEGAGILTIPSTLIWPGEYGLVQHTSRAKAMWIGCQNFFDANVEVNYSTKVVGVGPRSGDSDRPNQVMEDQLRLIGKQDHPIVTVDSNLATINSVYDVLDTVDPSLPCDRMMIIRNHTALGVTITRKVYAWSQQNHDDYFIYEYVLKNTGIINTEGTVHVQTLQNLVFFLCHRYALSGESVINDMEGWGAWESTWGRNVLNQVVFTDPDNPSDVMRAFYSYYGLISNRSEIDDWGCPNETDDGILAAAKYVGGITLHADTAPGNTTDDTNQPFTTMYLGSDSEPTITPYSQYDELFMAERYSVMTAGHASVTHADAVGDGYANEWGDDPGGYSQTTSFGPYQLAYGDSIKIIVAEAVNGISREKNREVGKNWLTWENHAGTPKLILPDGSETTDHNLYKDEWVWSCEDSLFKTFRAAMANFESDYTIPQPPPPPEEFTVTSGGDRIALTWADNATSDPYFNGYVIYRSEGNVLDPKTVYRKIFECSGGADLVHEYDDVTAARGFNYYYYIQSKDDGNQNDVEPGKPLYSSMFWTLTNIPAYRTTTNIDSSDDILCKSFQLNQNYPNPFNAVTTIEYGLPIESNVTITIFDINGRQIENLINSNHPQGYHTVQWNAFGYPSGIYFCKIQINNPAGNGFRKIRKMMLVK